jgi:hypothetical protein
MFHVYKGFVPAYCPYSPDSQSKADMQQRHMFIYHNIENEVNLTTQHKDETINIPLMKKFN